MLIGARASQETCRRGPFSPLGGSGGRVAPLRLCRIAFVASGFQAAPHFPPRFRCPPVKHHAGPSARVPHRSGLSPIREALSATAPLSAQAHVRRPGPPQTRTARGPGPPVDPDRPWTRTARGPGPPVDPDRPQTRTVRKPAECIGARRAHRPARRRPPAPAQPAWGLCRIAFVASGFQAAPHRAEGPAWC
jgi:hypothetical protein